MAITSFLDPKNNFAFLQIFGTEKNKDILIHFLNDILGYTGEEAITKITYLKTIQDPDIAAYRQSIIDVLCEDQHGTKFIVEMQVDNHKGFDKRAQYYAARAYSQQILTEDENHKKMAVYAKLKGVIFLAIADFIMFSDKKAWKSTHRLLDTKTYENDLKDFYFIFMELGKFKKTIDQLENIQEKWAYFFKHAHKSTLEDIEHLIGKDIIIRHAFNAIDQAGWTPVQLRTYDQLEKAKHDNLAAEEYKIEEAVAKEKAKNKEEKIILAKKMLANNEPTERITQYTGLTTEEIEKILEAINKGAGD